MKLINSSFFDIEPMSALRSTRTQTWLIKATEEYVIEYHNSFKPYTMMNGKEVWVRKQGTKDEKVIETPPNYIRTRKYLKAMLDYKENIKMIAEIIGYKQQEDAFFIWFLFPMPKSWTKKKKASMSMELHKNKKDADNLFKAFTDSVAPRKNKFSKNSNIIDDRVISSFACAKLYVPDDVKCGIMVNQYMVEDFMSLFIDDLKNNIQKKQKNEVLHI